MNRLIMCNDEKDKKIKVLENKNEKITVWQFIKAKWFKK